MTTQQSSPFGRDPRGTVSAAPRTLRALVRSRQFGLLAGIVLTTAIACRDVLSPRQPAATTPTLNGLRQRTGGKSLRNVAGAWPNIRQCPRSSAVLCSPGCVQPPVSRRPSRQLLSTASNRTTVIYVNGIRTALNDLTNSTGSVALLSTIVGGDSALEDARVTFFWNRNLAGQLAAYDSSSGCAGWAARGSGIRRALSVAVYAARCKVLGSAQKIVRIIAENDFIESMDQYLNIVFKVPVGVPADADSLSARLAAYYNRDSSDVIFVAHSQGNMILANAVHMLPDIDNMYQTPQRCLGALTFASPIGSTSFGLSGMIRGMEMNKDILLMLPNQNDFPRYDDDRTLLATSEIDGENNPFKKFSLRLSHGIKIHEVDWNYLTWQNSVDSVKSALRAIRHSCE